MADELASALAITLRVREWALSIWPDRGGSESDQKRLIELGEADNCEIITDPLLEDENDTLDADATKRFNKFHGEPTDAELFPAEWFLFKGNIPTASLRIDMRYTNDADVEPELTPEEQAIHDLCTFLTSSECALFSPDLAASLTPSSPWLLELVARCREPDHPDSAADYALQHLRHMALVLDGVVLFTGDAVVSALEEWLQGQILNDNEVFAAFVHSEAEVLTKLAEIFKRPECQTLSDELKKQLTPQTRWLATLLAQAQLLYYENEMTIEMLRAWTTERARDNAERIGSSDAVVEEWQAWDAERVAQDLDNGIDPPTLPLLNTVTAFLLANRVAVMQDTSLTAPPVAHPSAEPEPEVAPAPLTAAEAEAVAALYAFLISSECNFLSLRLVDSLTPSSPWLLELLSRCRAAESDPSSSEFVNTELTLQHLRNMTPVLEGVLLETSEAVLAALDEWLQEQARTDDDVLAGFVATEGPTLTLLAEIFTRPDSHMLREDLKATVTPQTRWLATLLAQTRLLEYEDAHIIDMVKAWVKQRADQNTPPIATSEVLLGEWKAWEAEQRALEAQAAARAYLEAHDATTARLAAEAEARAQAEAKLAAETAAKAAAQAAIEAEAKRVADAEAEARAAVENAKAQAASKALNEARDAAAAIAAIENEAKRLEAKVAAAAAAKAQTAAKAEAAALAAAAAAAAKAEAKRVADQEKVQADADLAAQTQAALVAAAAAEVEARAQRVAEAQAAAELEAKYEAIAIAAAAAAEADDASSQAATASALAAAASAARAKATLAAMADDAELSEQDAPLKTPSPEADLSFMSDPNWALSQVVGIGISPGRLDLLGGVSDYNGGLVLQVPLANTHTRVTIRYAVIEQVTSSSSSSSDSPLTSKSIIFRSGPFSSDVKATAPSLEWVLSNATPFWEEIGHSWDRQTVLFNSGVDLTPPVIALDEPTIRSAQEEDVELDLLYDVAHLCGEASVPTWVRYVWTSLLTAFHALTPVCEFVPLSMQGHCLCVEVRSNLPQGCGLGSNAALEVASMRAAADFANHCYAVLNKVDEPPTAASSQRSTHSDDGEETDRKFDDESPDGAQSSPLRRRRRRVLQHYSLPGKLLAHTAHAVEVNVLGASCSLAPHLTAVHGRPGCVLPILCRPDLVQPLLALPPGVLLVGWPSGVAKSTSKPSASAVSRTAAAMGRTIFEHSLHHASSKWRPSFSHTTDLTLGNLKRVMLPPSRRTFLDDLPVSMFGASFFSLHEAPSDPTARVDFSTNYPVRGAFTFPIEEHARCSRALELMRAHHATPVASSASSDLSPAVEQWLLEVGALMYESHAGYTAMGLGHAVTDTMVAQLRKLASTCRGIYGARLSGGGCAGGTVVVLCHTSALDSIRALCKALPSSRKLDLVF